MIGSRTSRIRRARLVPLALTTAALSSAVLGASVTGTLSAFTASITNSTNTATAGSLVMKETKDTVDGATSCLSSSGANNSYTSCGTIDKYGGTGTPFTPGTTHATTVFFQNTGTTRVSSFDLLPSACTRTGNDSMSTANLCDSLQLTVTCTPVANDGTPGTTDTVYTSQNLTTVAANGRVTLSANCTPQASSGNSVKFVFSVTMPSGQDNTVQGQTVSQPLTWTFTGA